MSAAPNRFLAHVQYARTALPKDWIGNIEFTVDGRTVTRLTIAGDTCIETLRECERVAEQNGFVLNWSGFVAHGVPVQREEDSGSDG